MSKRPKTDLSQEVTIYAPDRRFRFEQFVPIFGTSAVKRLVDAWRPEAIRWAVHSATSTYNQLCRFLKWVIVIGSRDSESVCARFIAAFQAGEPDMLTAELMYSLNELWASKLRDFECFEICQSTNLRTRSGLVDGISALIRRLSNAGLWPRPAKVRRVARGRMDAPGYPSIGELLPSESWQKAKSKYYSITKELDVNKISQFNIHRLAALKLHFSSILSSEFQKFEEGRLIINDEQIPLAKDAEHLLELLRAEMLKSGRGRAYFRSKHMLPEVMRAKENGTRIIAKYLAISDPHRRSPDDWTDTPLGSKVREFGGMQNALGYIEGGWNALIAAHAIVLIDTGMNVSTCDALAANPFKGALKRGRITIRTIGAPKLRSGGETQEAVVEEFELTSNSPDQTIGAVQAIRIWQSLSNRIRESATAAGSPSAHLLWAFPSDKGSTDRFRVPSSTAVNLHWHRLLKATAGTCLELLPIKRVYIRVTVLQIAAFNGNLEHSLPAALANHKNSRTTIRYLSRPWFEAALAQKMRVFLDAFEAAVLSNSESNSRISTNHAEYEERLSYARNTGLGFICAQPPPDTRQVPCTQVESCPSCSFRQFRPNEKSINALVLFNISLKAAAAEFELQNAKRWADIWLDSLALTEALLSQLAQSSHANTLKKSVTSVEYDIDNGIQELVELW